MRRQELFLFLHFLLLFHQMLFLFLLAFCFLLKLFSLDAREAGHTSGKDLGHLQPKTHLYTCDMAPLSFWWGSDAPEPLSGETLDPLEKTLAFPSSAGTGVEMG